MIRAVLKYLYLVLGTALAVLTKVASYGQAHARADPDDDGENERNPNAIANREQRRHERGDGPVSPMEAAEYRADEMVSNPLRTILLLVGYEAVFVGWAICMTFTDEVVALVGEDVGFIVKLLALPRVMYLPEWVVPLLVPGAVVVGLLFAVVIHQTVVTAGDIRYGTTDY